MSVPDQMIQKKDLLVVKKDAVFNLTFQQFK